jgi:hypothetical protein
MRVRENECTVFVVVDRRKADSEEIWEWEYKSDECPLLTVAGFSVDPPH